MTVQPPAFPALDQDITCDVAIIGSGIAGLSTAYELAKAGRNVVVLERGPIARGMTARTTAHLGSALDDYYCDFISLRGEDMARLLFASHAGAIGRIGEIAAEEGIACDYARITARRYFAGEAKEDLLDRECDALTKVGLAGASKQSTGSGHSLSDGPYLSIPDQGRFHPLKYLDGLAGVLKQLGAHIYAGTNVVRIDENEGVEIETSNGRRVSAGLAVLATNAPIKDDAKVTAKENPYRTYALAAEAPKGVIEDMLYWDTEDPYHYVRIQPAGDFDLLISGGEDHRSGEADDADRRFAKLEAWTRERFPEIGRVRNRWSGQVLETVDNAGFVGLNPGSERLYIATGDSGQGITHGVAASMIISSLITRGSHPWAEVLVPSRKPPKAIGNFLGGAVGAVKGLAENIVGGKDDEDHEEIAAADRLGPGEGGIFKDGKEKLAVARDEGGRLHRLSASCTHLGCVVHWNSFEQCWDCPCHGSQFAPDGAVLNGPAIKPLSSTKETAERTGADTRQG